jgi:hypothetical protein
MNDVPHREPAPRAHLEIRALTHTIKAGGPEHPAPRTAAWEPEDHRRVAVCTVAHSREGEPLNRRVWLFGRDEGAATQARDPLEFEQLVAKVEQDHPAEDEVEGAQVCRVGVVDVAEDSLDVRAQRFPSVVTPGASSIV